MNLSEFKAWFEGFTEDMYGPPNAKQWKRIKKRVSKITSDPTTWPIYIERYVKPYQPWWNPPVWVSTTNGTTKQNEHYVTYNYNSNDIPSTAFYSVGQAEMLQMSDT